MTVAAIIVAEKHIYAPGSQGMLLRLGVGTGEEGVEEDSSAQAWEDISESISLNFGGTRSVDLRSDVLE
jgi:hypothetical protein